MFHALLVVIATWFLLGWIATRAPKDLFRLFVSSPMIIGEIAALIVIRLGYFRVASLLYLVGVWITATSTTSLMGWIHSPTLILYGTLPVTAAWLLGYRGALCTAGLCLTAILVFAVLEMIGMVPRYVIPGTPLGLWWGAVHATLIGTFPVALIIRRLRETLAERQQMEATLRNSEERFRLATKATNDAIWDIDLKTGTVSWNDTYSRLYGRPAETSDSWQWWIERIHLEDRENTAAGLRSAIAGASSSWTCEYRFRRVSGEWAYIYDRAYIARDASGQAWRVIGAMQDLTERKSAEAALRESEERFRRMFEEGPLGVALVGKDYRFLKVNSALCQMLGYDESELVQMSFVDITCPDDVRTDVGLTDQIFKGEIPNFRMEKRYLKKNGEIIWINLTASVIRDDHGDALYGLGMVEDITEIKHAHEQTLVRQKLESVGTLAGGIAHDFNNLLGGVLAQAELGLAEIAAGSNAEAELNAVRNAAVRGSEIVRELMVYAGKESAVVGLVDVSQIVQEMLELLKVSTSKRAVVETNLGKDLPGVRGNAAQLRQIIMNLVTNASEAIGDRDGVIRVITRRVALSGGSSAGRFTALPAGDYVQVEVSDTGRGMSTEMQAKVFDPFFSTKSAGRGLGLAVVQGIVRSLGGDIRLTSELNKGTRFQISLPCADSAGHATGLGDIGGKVVPTPHCTVLVVEDEDPLRRAIVKMLVKTGFEVFEAADGTAAIARLRADGDKVDVMLLDLTIPGASRDEVIAEAAKAKPDIGVILTSAYSQEMIASEMSPLPIRGFIRKPFQFEDLLGALRRDIDGDQVRSFGHGLR